MNRKKKGFGNNFIIESGEHKEQGNCNIRPQRCSSLRELPTAPPRELRAAAGEVTETQGKTEDAPAGKTFHSLNFTNQREGEELLTGRAGSTQPPSGVPAWGQDQLQDEAGTGTARDSCSGSTTMQPNHPPQSLLGQIQHGQVVRTILNIQEKKPKALCSLRASKNSTCKARKSGCRQE